MNSKTFLLAAILLCLPSFLFSQNVQKTLEKPFESWSQDEASKIAYGLPWANQYQSEEGLAAASQLEQRQGQADTNISGGTRGSMQRGLGPQPLTIQLRSALPIRQALYRLRQIAAGYDKLSEDDRNTFKETNSVLLNCPICADYYVVTLTKWKNSSMGAVDVGLFQDLKLENLKGQVWLANDRNEKRELVQFAAPKKAGEPAIFYFKRIDEQGKEFLTPENKEFKFVFAPEFRESDASYRLLLPRSFDFKVSKIIMDGKVAF